jgi:hypothetical protein
MAISRRWWLPAFYRQNGLAVVRELAILVPIDLMIGLLRSGANRHASLRDEGHSGDRACG